MIYFFLSLSIHIHHFKLSLEVVKNKPAVTEYSACGEGCPPPALLLHLPHG